MKYIFKKLCTLIITLFIVSLLAFYAFALIGDPTTSMLGTNATPEQVASGCSCSCRAIWERPTAII